MKQLLISFSGGATSAYMTKMLLDNLDPKQYEIAVVFANTGREREETLEFVRECDLRWNFNTVWVECVTNPERGKGVTAKVVTFETASRNGEPFEESIKKHGMPNVRQSICTRELKTYTINAYMRQIRWKHYHRAIGIRIDEIDRINPKYEKERIIYPCVSMFPSRKEDINAFWAEQDFRLNLKSYQGNCDCCFKKSLRKLLTIASQEPVRFKWWVDMEAKYGSYIPESRKHNSVNLPFHFFRGNMSAKDILDMSVGFTDFATDDSKKTNSYKRLSLFGNELDTPNGCSESCEAF